MLFSVVWTPVFSAASPKKGPSLTSSLCALAGLQTLKTFEWLWSASSRRWGSGEWIGTKVETADCCGRGQTLKMRVIKGEGRDDGTSQLAKTLQFATSRLMLDILCNTKECNLK